MRQQTTVELPGGWLDAAGVCYREATLRPLRGYDEEWLYGLPPRTTRLAPLVTELLLRCVGRVGPSPPTRDTIRSMLVGDRGYLMLKLHQVTFGDQLEMVLVCPRTACSARMDVDFQLDALPVRRATHKPSYQVEQDVGVVRFRLPSGADLEDVGVEEGGAATLLGRCILAGANDAAEFSAALVASLEVEMERVSSGVEREIEATCPECHHAFEVAFDPVVSFIAEVWRRRHDFDREVHLLSFHYHWPLGEILRMARPRRQAYVALLLGQIDLVGVAVAAAR